MKNARIDPLVIKTEGKVRTPKPNPSPAPRDEPENIEDAEETDINIPEIAGDVSIERFVSNRLADKLCFVCKAKIGSVHNKRIGKW